MLAFDQSPIDVERRAIESESFDFLEDVEPQRRNGKSVHSVVNATLCVIQGLP